MAVEIFAIKSGVQAHRYGVTIQLPGTGNIKYDYRVPYSISTVENKYSGTLSYSGEITRQLFG